MKLQKVQSVFLAVCLALLMWRCGNEETVLPDLEGSLVGYVYTFDEFANLLDDHSGVIVTAFGLQGRSQSRTNTYGRFEFTSLTAGTYELHIEKTGFGTMKQFGVQHLGGQPTTLGLSFSGSVNSEAFFIYQMPTTEILDLVIENDTITAGFGFAGPEPEYLTLLLYFSDEPGFDIAHAKQAVSRHLHRGEEFYAGKLYGEYLVFEPGAEIYFRACLLNTEVAITDFNNRIIGGIDNYFDYTNNTTVYPNLGNASDQYSFILPD